MQEINNYGFTVFILSQKDLFCKLSSFCMLLLHSGLQKREKHLNKISYFLYQKHMLWLSGRTLSVIRFFWGAKSMIMLMNKWKNSSHLIKNADLDWASLSSSCPHLPIPIFFQFQWKEYNYCVFLQWISKN